MTTPELNALPVIEIDNPATAKQQLPAAEASLRAASAAQEQAEALKTERLEVEAEDRRAEDFLRKEIDAHTEARKDKYAKVNHELRALRESCDVKSLAQDLKADEDTLALLTNVRADLIERLMPLHKLETLESEVALSYAKASEADLLALVSHIRTVIRLEDAYKEEGRIGFIGQRTQELIGIARDLREAAAQTENRYREARAAFEKQQAALVSRGIVTRRNVNNAIASY